jgi:hypothetical protein
MTDLQHDETLTIEGENLPDEFLPLCEDIGVHGWTVVRSPHYGVHLGIIAG